MKHDVTEHDIVDCEAWRDGEFVDSTVVLGLKAKGLIDNEGLTHDGYSLLFANDPDAPPPRAKSEGLWSKPTPVDDLTYARARVGRFRDTWIIRGRKYEIRKQGKGLWAIYQETTRPLHSACGEDARARLRQWARDHARDRKCFLTF